MRLCWASKFRIAGGLTYGYTSANNYLREACRAIGIEITDSAPTAVHFCHAEDYAPLPGKKNVILTMTESSPVPPPYIQCFKQVDAIFAPSRFVYNLFYPVRAGKPLLISKLGFEPEVYTYKLREWEQEDTFHFLWIGASNIRKGWDKVISTWAHLFQEQTWCHLTMKTSSVRGEGQVVERGNVTFDSRRYDDLLQLRDLYHAAHCAVLPTMGEGFQLCALESLATGLPVIGTRYGGQLDFLDEKVAYFASHVMEEFVSSETYPFHAACTNVGDLGRKMLEVVKNYPVALLKAARGAERVHKDFTWRRAALQLKSNIEKLGFPT